MTELEDVIEIEISSIEEVDMLGEVVPMFESTANTELEDTIRVRVLPPATIVFRGWPRQIEETIKSPAFVIGFFVSLLGTLVGMGLWAYAG